jgi:hypothetical protein
MLGANVRDRHLPDVEPLGDTDDPLLAFVPIARVGVLEQATQPKDTSCLLHGLLTGYGVALKLW